SFVMLDTPGFNGGVGYQLKVIRGESVKTLDADLKRAAFCLRIAPDGGRAVFYLADHPQSSLVQLRFVDLRTGETQDSPVFRSQEATFDGRPQLFWDAAGEGVFCHVSRSMESKWPFELTRYDPTAKKGSLASQERNVGASCVLDQQHVAVWRPDGGGCSVVRWSDGFAYALPEYNYILGGRGRHVVVADLERDGVYAATLELVDGDR
ncbi:MAG: hypothetical protein KDA41_11510, partial [Planctomycetales bacterium]|nr:hypothetical protein [Planctomycetales bacterium]